MNAHTDRLRLILAQGPAGARQLIEKLGISQPTLSRTIVALGAEVLRWGAARSIQYALRDNSRGLADLPVYRVAADGRLRLLGTLVPVRPDGFVMHRADGQAQHSHGLPWWLLDMRPQGFLGRAYVDRYAAALGLPARLADWNDTHALRALVAHGHDAVGNLVLGDVARDHFLNEVPPPPILAAHKGEAFARLAQAAAQGEQPGSSAGGEQPKFVACVQEAGQPVHVLVKFSLPGANPVTERWRDLLLAEHLALQTLEAHGVLAAHSQVTDHGGQRFLELKRFDRVGAVGRRALFSLAAVEAEFVGNAASPWPVITARLAADGHITPEAVQVAALLYAFGGLIGNTDMHNGNLSLVSDHGRPYALAPAYDMLPMGFAPRASGALPDSLPPCQLHASVPHVLWERARHLATDYLTRLRAEERFSAAFGPCILALTAHLDVAAAKIARLG